MNRFLGPRRDPSEREDGWSMVEVAVSMVILSIFMAMMTTGVIEVFRAVNGSTAIADAQSQVNLAFLKLDRDVRYASDISTEGQVNGDWYVEYLSTYTGTAMCSELRLSAAAKTLQRRTWVQGTTPPATWTLLATGVSSAKPFTVTASSTYAFPRLRLDVTAVAGGGSTAATKQFSVTFTVVNARGATPTVCTEGRTS